MAGKEELLRAYSQKESSELALANLVKLKADASFDEAEYLILQTKHIQSLEKAKHTLKLLRTKLRKDFNAKTRENEKLNGELSLLYSRLKAGELSTAEHSQQANPIKEKIAQLEKQLAELELLLNSRSSADLTVMAVSPSQMAQGNKETQKVTSAVEKKVEPRAEQLKKSDSAERIRNGSIFRRHPVVSVIIGLCVIGLIVLGLMASKEAPIVCPSAGSPAPGFTLTTTDGKSLSLSDFKGKVLMLYFWNFDCPPCDREMWNIMAVYDKWAKRDFAVLAVNEKDTLQTAKEYAANRKLPFPVLMDTEGLLKKQYCISTELPVSILINADGIISTIKTGAFEGTDPLEKIVRGLAVQKGIDIEPPLISNVAVSGILEDNATITWLTNEPATTQVVVTLPEGFTSPKAVSELTRNHTVILNGLKPATGYQFKIVALDGSGNVSDLTDKSQAFTTLASVPIGTEIGKRAPDFTLLTVEGKSITLSSLIDKVVMVNFWSKSCSSCLREIPHIQDIYDKKLSDKFVILAIHVADGSSEAKEFASKWKITFPVLLDTQDKASNSYHIDHYPVTFFVDGKGIIRQIKDGLFNSPAEIENIIGPLLKNL